MSGPLDILRTRLVLEDDFTQKATAAKVVADDLADELSAVENAGGNLGDIFRNAALDAASANPVLQNLSVTATRLSTTMGESLGSSIASTTALIASPTGMIAAATALAAAMAAVTYGVTFGAGAIGTALASVMSAAPSLLTGFATIAGPALSMPFINAAAEMDRFKRQFTAIFGGQNQGEQVAKWMQDYGLTSALNQSSLAQLIKTIGLAQQDVARFLPVLETYTFLNSDNPDAMVEDIASVFRRLVGGQTAEALGPDGLGRFGINKSLLETYGARFDKQGRFLGSTQDALLVLERLSKESPMLKDLRAVMESSIDTQQSNAFDAIKMLMTEVGELAANYVLPMITQATTWIRNLAQSGAMKDLIDAWAGIMGGTDGLKPVIAGVLTILEEMPRVLEYSALLVSATGMAISAMIKSIADALDMIGDASNMIIPGGGMLFKIGAQGLRDGAAFAEWLGNTPERLFGEDGAWADTYKKYMDAMTREQEKGGVLPTGTGGVSTETMTANQHLAAIEKNTREMVEAQRIVLGGGQLGALGVTAVDVFGGRRGPARGGSVGEVLTSSLMDDMFDRLIAGRISGAGMAR